MKDLNDGTPMTDDPLEFRYHASSILSAMAPASITLPKESIGSILGAMTPAAFSRMSRLEVFSAR
jgi:hypothetical protein